MTTTPSPGSQEAKKLGCTCPVLDNNCGRGFGYPTPMYWIDNNCPIHGDKGWRKEILKQRGIK